MDIREESPRTSRAWLAEVGPWRLRVSRTDATGWLYASAYLDEDRGSVSATGIGKTPDEVIAQVCHYLQPLTGDLSGDIADGLAALFDALETAETPIAPPCANPVDLRVHVGPTDVGAP